MKSHPTFIQSLQEILDIAHTQEKIKLEKIFQILSGRGYATLLVLFSLPFCTPLSIPGVSTLFGFILAFIGLRLAFGKHLWWPQWILEKELSSHKIEKLVKTTMRTVKGLQKFVHPRLTLFTDHSYMKPIQGLLVFLLALLLALPLPIPFTNMLAALPIFCMGLGLLEDDGLLMIIGYILAFICFAFFFGLFMFGKAQLAAFFG